MKTRVERRHHYDWWAQDASGECVISEGEAVGYASVVCDYEAEPRPDERVTQSMHIPDRAIPALIAALTSYQSRIDASENEDSDDRQS